MQAPDIPVVLRAYNARRFSAHLGLREIENNHAAVDESGAGAVTRVGHLDRVVRMHHCAVFVNHVRQLGHLLLPSPDEHGCRVAYPVEREEVTPAKHARFAFPHNRIAYAAAKRAPRAHTILHDHREPFAAPVGEVPEEACVAARGVQVPQFPPVPYDARKRLFVVARRPMCVRRPNRTPPIPALEATLRVARIDHDPPRRPRPKPPVTVAHQFVVRARRTRKRGRQIRLDIRVGPNQNPVAPLPVRNGVQTGLNGVECPLPCAPVRIIALFRHVDGRASTPGAIRRKRLPRLGTGALRERGTQKCQCNQRQGPHETVLRLFDAAYLITRGYRDESASRNQS